MEWCNKREFCYLKGNPTGGGGGGGSTSFYLIPILPFLAARMR